MAMNVTRADVWVAGLQDRPGAAAEKLQVLAAAGVNLEFVLARRAPEKPGTAVLFVCPLAGSKQLKAAKAAGFHKSKSLHGLRIEGPDKAGTGAAITQVLGARGLNLRGMSAAVIGRRFVTYLALYTAADVGKAARALKVM